MAATVMMCIEVNLAIATPGLEDILIYSRSFSVIIPLPVASCIEQPSTLS
jgi:hypothetical protein